jgi:lipopolysaccharide/colanic/teichoic acid biosynthesis glycosyltransferase
MRALSTVGKRALDIAASVLGLVLLAPVLAVLFIVSWRVFRATPLFVQDRVGRGGRTIRVAKVRSLPVDAPLAADKSELREVAVPRWGSFIRRTHLDELPQLVCVVIGTLSLVGPRPEIPRLAESFDPEFASDRAEVRPGLTGLWQLSAEAAGQIADAPEYDRFYVANRSMWLDLWVLWRTLRSYLPGSRPITLDDVPMWLTRASSSTLTAAGEGVLG